jgi:sarcosine oxidase subunit gamma
LSEVGPLARFIFRGSESARQAAESTLGIGLPAQPCRAVVEGSSASLWLGPDEWLLLASPEGRDRVTGALTQALEQIPHALVDISARQIGLLIAGPRVEDVLSAGCPLDLDLAAFPPGMCARTLFAKAEIVLWRVGETEFRVEVARSFAPYVRDLLAQVTADAA